MVTLVECSNVIIKLIWECVWTYDLNLQGGCLCACACDQNS